VTKNKESGVAFLKDSLINLCKLHDEIKNSDLRLAGLDEANLPIDAKDRYYTMLDNLTSELLNYVEKFKDEYHVRFGLRFGIVRGYIPSLFKQDLDFDYHQNNEFIDFIANTDFTVLSKVHMIIEYMYHLLTNEWWTPGFQVRIIGMA
jgi:hypothetical protein